MISVENLSVQIGDRSILDTIHFELPLRGFLAVLGPNGGGKSTLVRCLLGLQSFTGNILYRAERGSDLTLSHGGNLSQGSELVIKGASRPRIGYVPQIKTLDRTFPAKASELVATALKKKWPWNIDSTCTAVVDDALERVGAKHLKDQQIRSLSGGELQRVYLARAVIGNPKLLILDEPSAGVDQAGAADLLEIVESYRKRAGAAVVMVTHDWEVAFHHATHVLVLKTNQISYGPADEAMTETAIREAFGHVGHSHGVLIGGHSHA